MHCANDLFRLNGPYHFLRRHIAETLRNWSYPRIKRLLNFKTYSNFAMIDFYDVYFILITQLLGWITVKYYFWNQTMPKLTQLSWVEKQQKCKRKRKQLKRRCNILNQILVKAGILCIHFKHIGLVRQNKMEGRKRSGLTRYLKWNMQLQFCAHSSSINSAWTSTRGRHVSQLRTLQIVQKVPRWRHVAIKVIAKVDALLLRIVSHLSMSHFRFCCYVITSSRTDVTFARWRHAHLLESFT